MMHGRREISAPDHPGAQSIVSINRFSDLQILTTHKTDQHLKRLFDFCVALMALVVLSPILIIAICIAAAETRTNGIFRQERIGVAGKPFNIFKLRTMRPAPSELQSSTTGEHDPRITPLGRWLRKFKVDELPQLANVLIGDMSLVGPRPTVAEDYEKMSPVQKRRNDVRPGITGVAQVNGNTSLRWNQRIKFDLYYIRNWSFRLDILLLLKTATMILSNNIETHPQDEEEW